MLDLKTSRVFLNVYGARLTDISGVVEYLLSTYSTMLDLMISRVFHRMSRASVDEIGGPKKTP